MAPVIAIVVVAVVVAVIVVAVDAVLVCIVVVVVAVVVDVAVCASGVRTMFLSLRRSVPQSKQIAEVDT